MLTIDTLAQRYGKLPSEIVRDASTYDLHVMDIKTQYEIKESNEKANKERGKTELDPARMDAMMEEAARVKKELIENAKKKKCVTK